MYKMTQKENFIRTINRDNPGWVPFRYSSGLTSFDPAVIPRAMDGGLDDWGVNWLPSGTDEGSYPDDKPVMSLVDVEMFTPPKTNWQDITNKLKFQINDKGQDDTLIIARNELVLFERVKYLLGTNECLMAFLLNPDQMHILLDKIVDYQINLTRSMMESGVAGVRFTDDWGVQNSLFISPEQWRIFFKPRMKKLYAVVREYNGIVFQHSCGNVEEIVSDLIEIGVNVLDPCQPGANDILSWKKKYGNTLCFMGGLDTQTYLSFGTPQEVKQEVTKVISVMSANGGYIAAPSHTISLPKKNKEAMLEAIEEWNDLI